MRIALAQINPTVGDVAANAAKIASAIDRARQAGAELVVFSELSLCGYPPRDLLARGEFISANEAALHELAAHCTDIAALVGYAGRSRRRVGRRLINAAALLAGGRCVQTHAKKLLPTYDVFDETRYFEPARRVRPLAVGDRSVGVVICEDLWDDDALGHRLYADDPVGTLVEQRAEVLIHMAASPYQMGKPALRRQLIARQARRFGRPIVSVNQVGGNDELIFDGASLAVGADGSILALCRSFDEDLQVVDLDAPVPAAPPDETDELADLKAALELGLRDYVTKCGFTQVVLGLSGGIDSALVAVLAADALGPDNVLALAMPSRFSSDHSIADAEALAANLGIRLQRVPIEPMHAGFDAGLAELLAGTAPDITEENLQARIRGTIVMAASNKFGHLPLATGNKSELSTGYCTLYGDMCGGLAVIGDVPKTLVYALSRHINAAAGRERIPQRTLDKPPSAELKADQRDQDSLPPYDVLDAILSRYVERDMSIGRIVEAGFDEATVREVVRLVDRAEYKRRQAAPVLKVTARAFGSGRRMPIAQRFSSAPSNRGGIETT